MVRLPESCLVMRLRAPGTTRVSAGGVVAPPGSSARFTGPVNVESADPDALKAHLARLDSMHDALRRLDRLSDRFIGRGGKGLDVARLGGRGTC